MKYGMRYQFLFACDGVLGFVCPSAQTGLQVRAKTFQKDFGINKNTGSVCSLWRENAQMV